MGICAIQFRSIDCIALDYAGKVCLCVCMFVFTLQNVNKDILTIVQLEFIITLGSFSSIQMEFESRLHFIIVYSFFWPMWCHSTFDWCSTTPSQLFIRVCECFSLCFYASTVISTGHLYNISINDKFVGNNFVSLPFYFVVIFIYVCLPMRISYKLIQSAYIVCINCVAGWQFAHFFRNEFQWDERIFFFSSNICIKLSLCATITLHIIRSI